MKKFFIICILLVSVIPFFQNCGQQALNGNGDPYEDGHFLDVGGGGYQNEQPPNGANFPGTLERSCTGTGAISRVEFRSQNTYEMIYFTTYDNKSRSVRNSDSSKNSFTLNVTFDSKITIKSLTVFSNSVTIGVDKLGAFTNEQLTCVAH